MPGAAFGPPSHPPVPGAAPLRSPDALSALQDEAAGLNENANALYAKINEALNNTSAAQDAMEEPADDAYPAAREGEEEAEGEGAADEMDEIEEEGAAEED